MFTKIFLFFILYLYHSINNVNASTPLPLPRFAILSASNVNLHVGPGKNFKVSWRYQLKYMPVEVIAQFDTWREIRDFQGTKGWVHQSLLKGKRYVMVINQTQALKDSPSIDSRTVAYIEPFVVGKVYECQGHWCLVAFTDNHHQAGTGKTYKGWVPRQGVWGVYLHETKM